MNASFKIEGLDALRKELKAATDKNIVLEIRKAWGEIGAEIADDAKSNHRFNTQSGNLERSLVPVVDRAGKWMYVKAEKGIAPYAKIVHDGRKARTITAKKAKALAWPTSGGTAFAKSVHQEAVQGDPFLLNAFMRHVDKIKERLVLAYREAINK